MVERSCQADFVCHLPNHSAIDVKGRTVGKVKYKLLGKFQVVPSLSAVTLALYEARIDNKQILGRTSRLLSFDRTWTA
jgi:hypothetical protein